MISVRATTVAGGLAFVLVSWGMLDSSKATLARQFGRVQRQDASLTLDHPADAATLTALARIPGVAATEPSIEIPASLGNAAYSTSLIGLRPGAVMHGFPRRLPANGALIVVALLARLPGLRALAQSTSAASSANAPTGRGRTMT